MSFRVACIYVEEQSSLKEVRLEVCNDGSSNQIAPFIRKATVTDMLADSNPMTREFAALLKNLGFEQQPFVLSGEVLMDAEVAGILCKNSYSFIQSGKSRTLKKGRLFLDARNCGLKEGRLLGGTLYINNPADWKAGIDVRLSYEDAVAEVLPVCNDYPLRTVRGGYVKRDEQAEKSLLATLLPYVVNEKGTISLAAYDVDYLKALEEQGWTVMYAKGKGKAAKLHFRRTASGIDWFSTAEDVDDDISGKLLEAYLHGRHFLICHYLSLFRSVFSRQLLRKAVFYIKKCGLTAFRPQMQSLCRRRSAPSGIRTRTPFCRHRILSPLRLPFRHRGKYRTIAKLY